MQSDFTPEQLADPATAAANGIIRNCVHCGFCTATCPTYLLQGDELDSPRGRIYLIKDMLEKGGTPATAAVTHVDRCLSCLSCMTTCPSDVNYMHLVDTARAHIEAKFRRPWPDRALRKMLSMVLPRRGLFRLSLRLSGLVRPFAGLFPGRLKAMLAMAPGALPVAGWAENPGVFAASGPRLKRVALHAGCVQPVLRPSVDEATIRLLNRQGVEVVIAPAQGCCGALDHHMGKTGKAAAFAKANILAWEHEIDGAGLDAIIITASGCGTVIKDYAHLLASEPAWEARARRICVLAVDVSEFLAGLPPLPSVIAPGLAIAYHSACSLQHGQSIRTQPKQLLQQAGFAVRDVPEGHICCGSAGTYSILQPDLSQRLKARKLGNIARTGAAIVASGNIGCMTYLAGGAITTVHTAELLDWASGGPRPPGI
jgi:glycolate oxidase iron-sulfur subunit